jgi:CheY-like chemotaxis protein
MGSSNTNKTILVIDDSTTNVVLLQAVLNNKGYSIETALNVKDAYTIMNRKMPDLILLDLLMPRINGYEFLKEIKANDKTSKIPVIVVSALTDQENIQRSMDLGANEFITKPVDIQKLLEKVDSVLKYRQ